VVLAGNEQTLRVWGILLALVIDNSSVKS
jgi:hypothetical protein